MLKELDQTNKNHKGNTTGQNGAVRAESKQTGDRSSTRRRDNPNKEPLHSSTWANPFESTWIQKLITTKLRQKDLEHHLRCHTQDVELGVWEEERILSMLIFKLAKVFTI